MPRTLRITDACSGSVAATAGCSGAEAAQRDVNCVLKASQTAQKQQQQPLELIAASQLKSLARAGCFSTKAAKTGLKCNLVGPFHACLEANTGQGQLNLYQLKAAGYFWACGVLFVCLGIGKCNWRNNKSVMDSRNIMAEGLVLFNNLPYFTKFWVCVYQTNGLLPVQLSLQGASSRQAQIP